MEVVREIADSVARIADGRIIESGSVEDIILDPESILAHELLPDRPRVPLRDDGEVWEVSYASRDVPLDGLTSIQHAPGLSGTRVSVLSASVESIRGIAVGRAVLALSPGRHGFRTVSDRARPPRPSRRALVSGGGGVTVSCSRRRISARVAQGSRPAAARLRRRPG